MYTRHVTGISGEKLARDFLIRQNYSIIATNYRCRAGEIDIIALKDNKLAFIEVKTRSSDKKGLPHEAYTYGKMKRLSRAIQYYLHTEKPSIQRYACHLLSILYTEGKPVIKLYENAPMAL